MYSAVEQELMTLLPRACVVWENVHIARMELWETWGLESWCLFLPNSIHAQNVCAECLLHDSEGDVRRLRTDFLRSVERACEQISLLFL